MVSTMRGRDDSPCSMSRQYRIVHSQTPSTSYAVADRSLCSFPDFGRNCLPWADSRSVSSSEAKSNPRDFRPDRKKEEFSIRGGGVRATTLIPRCARCPGRPRPAHASINAGLRVMLPTQERDLRHSGPPVPWSHLHPRVNAAFP